MTAPLTPDIARANPNRTLGILVLGAISYALAQTMIIPALPAIQHDLGASQEAATWLLTAFLLTSSVESGFTDAFVMSAVAACVALVATSLIPRHAPHRIPVPLGSEA